MVRRGLKEYRYDLSVPVIRHTCCPEDYAAHFPGEESAPAETLGYEPDIPVVPDAHFPPISVIREGVCFHRHLS